MKLTAVEWLIEQIQQKLYIRDSVIQKAKEMQKEQHGNTWDEAIKAHGDRGGVISRSICDFDEYYNETYQSNK